MLVNFCVKNPETFIKYYYSSFIVKEAIPTNFPVQLYVEEVKQLNKTEKKKYKKAIQLFLTTATSFLALSSRSMAASLNQVPTIDNLGNGISPELWDAVKEILNLSVKAGIVLAILLLTAAAFCRMFGKKEKAIEWSNDIIRGLIQVLIAVPIVLLLYYVVTLFLNDFSIFNGLFDIPSNKQSFQ